VKALTLAAATVAVAVAAFVAYGFGFPNTDATWTLVWGRELLHFDVPSFSRGPTPHPLSNLEGVLAQALYPHSETVLLVLGFLAVGALVVGVFVVGRTMFGVWAGLLAAALVFTRDTLLFYGALAYIDVVFAALVVWALALEARRPRCGIPVLILLAVAGLARPEGWLLSVAYWLYARPPDRREAMRWGLLAVAAPVLWVAIDLVLTGNPVFSFTTTTDDTAGSGRPSGLHGLVTDGAKVVARTARPEVCVAAIAGLFVAHRSGHLKLLGGTLVLLGLGTALPVLAGGPLNDRYFIAVMAVLCLLAAAPVALIADAGERRWQLAGIACLVLLAIGAVDQAPRFLERRDDVVDRDTRREAAHDAIRAGVPCYPLVVPNNRFVAVTASWLDVPLDDVRDGRDGVPPGSYLWGTEDAMRNLIVVEGRPEQAAPAPSAPVVRRSGGWTLSSRCAAAG
jgi:hypothetical protein